MTDVMVMVQAHLTYTATPAAGTPQTVGTVTTYCWTWAAVRSAEIGDDDRTDDFTQSTPLVADERVGTRYGRVADFTQ